MEFNLRMYNHTEMIYYLKSIKYVANTIMTSNLFRNVFFKRNHNGYKLYNLYGYIVLCD